MKKKADLLDWIDIDNAEQIQWVNEYLARHLPSGRLEIYHTSDMAILNHNIPVPLNADLILFIKKMRSAWRQKQFRSKQNGKKTYSFVMSVNVEKQLKTLAGSQGEIRQTLEQLINERFKGETPIIMELKNKYKELQAKAREIEAENLKIKKVNHRLNKDCRYKDDELRRLQTEVKQLQQDKANLSNELKQLKEKHNNQFRNGDFE